MSKADKMFNELGYIDRFNDNMYVLQHVVEYCIYFNKDEKSVLFLFEDDRVQVSYKILLAVSEKIKELGWLDEK